MRVERTYGSSQPDDRHGERKGRRRHGGEETASNEFGPQERGRRGYDRRDGGSGPQGARGRGGGRPCSARRCAVHPARRAAMAQTRLRDHQGLRGALGGRYIPSPGTVYPTLQYLEDQGFVRANQEAERRTYQLTEAGQAELDAQAEQVTAFWKRFADQRRRSDAA
ncbi:MAG: PadR family transcriptional regulator [Anaerolineales bacterium]|nr:PadR family transcriptional regulator [Anaerolineales bacterium]